MLPSNSKLVTQLAANDVGIARPGSLLAFHITTCPALRLLLLLLLLMMHHTVLLQILAADPASSELLADLLLPHLRAYLVEDEDQLSPLLLRKCAHITQVMFHTSGGHQH